MNGSIPDSLIALCTLEDIRSDVLHKDDEKYSKNTHDGGYDILCVAMESKFQYISFANGKQIAVLDIALTDRSSVDIGNISHSSIGIRGKKRII